MKREAEENRPDRFTDSRVKAGEGPADDAVILLGTGFANLVTASLLLQKRRKVLLLKGTESRYPFRKNGYSFHPFSNFSERHLDPVLLRRISQVLSVSLSSGASEGEKAARTDDVCQVILPAARVDLFPDWPRFRKECEREFPGEAARIEQLRGELDAARNTMRREKLKEGYRSLWPLRSASFFRRFLPAEPPLDLSPFSQAFRKTVELHLLSRGNLVAGKFALSLAAHLLSAEPCEEDVPGADLEEVKEAILKSVLSRGGRVEELEGIESIESVPGGGFTVLPRGEHPPMRTSFLVLQSTLEEWSVLPEMIRREIDRRREKIRPRYLVCPLFVGMREKGIPVGMKDRVISLRSLEKPYEDGNLLLIHMSPKNDEVSAPGGKRAITVQGLVSRNDGEATADEELEIESNAITDHFRDLFPFSEGYTEFFESPPSLSSCPAFYESLSGFRWREGPLPIRISKGLYVSGTENFPHLGAEGEFLSGAMVAAEIAKAGKAGS